LNRPPSLLDAQLHALLERVAALRDARCAGLDQAAAEERRAILTAAHGEARLRMRQAVHEERARAERRIAEAQAAVEGRARQARHARALELLAQARAALPAALHRRWDEAAARRDWIAGVLTQAFATLPPGPWGVEHPPTLDGDELAHVRNRIADFCGEAPILRADATLGAGLRLRAGSAFLDGSVDGLLADRTAVEARLLTELRAYLDRIGTAEATG
jgi:hypothetical protein